MQHYRSKKDPRQRLPWVHLCPVCPDCTRAHMHVFVRLSVPALRVLAQHLHYTVTVNQSAAPRQPCRLATRVWFTEGRLQPGAKGKKTEGKRKARSLALLLAFHLSLLVGVACAIPAFTLLTSRNSSQSLDFGSILTAACNYTLKHI